MTFEDWYASGGALTAVEQANNPKESLRLAYEAGKRATQPEEMTFVHTPDEPKDQQVGEEYLTWLKRTLSFARTYGTANPDGSWNCGYCALGRHEDCLVDCGCPNPACQPHSSGSTGGGYPSD